MKFNGLKILFIIFICSGLTAQNRINASVSISVSLIKGLSLNMLKSNLDFGEIILSPMMNKITKDAKDGILFEVAGDPGKSVTINFSPIRLSNSDWAKNFGNPESQIDFIPNVFVSQSSDLSKTQSIFSGSAVNLSKENDGKLYVGIGGDLNLPNNQLFGDYSGNFSLTVAY